MFAALFMPGAMTSGSAVDRPNGLFICEATNKEANVLNDIHDRLTRAKEQLRRKLKFDSMLREAQVILKQEQRNCSQYEQILASEKADVEKLEGLSLTGLFYSILGTKEERLESERQEHLAAKLKHEQCSQAIRDAQQAGTSRPTTLAAIPRRTR